MDDVYFYLPSWWPISFMPQYEELADEIVKSGAIPKFVALLHNGDDDQKDFAADAFGLLVNHDAHRDAVIRAGIISDLVRLVRYKNDDQRHAADALESIAISKEGAQAIIEAGVIPTLISLIKHGNSGQKDCASTVFVSIAEHNEHSEAIISAGVIPVLIKLLKDGDFEQCGSYPFSCMTKCEELADEIVKLGVFPIFVTLLRDGDDKQKEYAAYALAGLANHDAYRDAVIRAGILSDLVCLVRDRDYDQKEGAADALGNIANSTEGAKAVVDASAISALVAFLNVEYDDGDKENAVGALWNLARHSNEACLQLITKENVALLVALVESGEDEVRALATGALGFIGVDETTKSAIAERGGIDVLLGAIKDADVDEEEGLMALLSLSKDSVAVCSSVLSEDNADILTTLAKSEDKSVKRLAGEILKQARDKKSDG